MAISAEGNDPGNAKSGHWATNYYNKALEFNYFSAEDITAAELALTVRLLERKLPPFSTGLLQAITAVTFLLLMNPIVTGTKRIWHIANQNMITYDEVRKLGALEAFLDITPNPVKAGDSFDLEPGAYAADGLKSMKLELVAPDGTTTLIDEWEGKGVPNEEMHKTVNVLTRKDPDRPGYVELSHDGGKIWLDGPKIDVE